MNTRPGRIAAGTVLAPRALTGVDGAPVALPDGEHLARRPVGDTVVHPEPQP